jgi:hypothetical protein
MNSSGPKEASGLAVLVKCRSSSINTYRRYGRAGDEPSHQHHTFSQTSSLLPPTTIDLTMSPSSSSSDSFYLR